VFVLGHELETTILTRLGASMIEPDSIWALNPKSHLGIQVGLEFRLF